MSDTDVRNTIIVGSGPAGLTASIYAARANLKPLCIEGFNAGGLIPGGQLMFTTDVENYPGFPDGITGPELMQRFREQAEKQGTELVTADVTKVDLGKRPFEVWVDDDCYRGKTLILATGARANYLGLPNEELLKNKGVSACAVCDGALYRDKRAVVVGGGDVAVEEAIYLTSLCAEVTLIHRRDELRASKAMADRALANDKLKILWNHVVVDVKDVAQDMVTAVTVENVKTGERSDYPTDALFLAIGHTPMTELFQGQLELHDNGYIKVEPGTAKTSVPGVFAAGDVHDFVYRQAVTAAGSGCMAALEAERWLASEGAH
ncbi:MAG: thioredoxin-disulfide reductase [Deltaproteobacteria bacterium]|jgi:thioredoxin reductase (NADPH)|nr:thioredoxin-disulfide reductase [Deltaproteobacteria bacterium]MBW2532669.1 thioredoxin-disulfide reductase [Deltaproteobacteria bacterium]